MAHNTPGEPAKVKISESELSAANGLTLPQYSISVFRLAAE
jgi:hypothetical protein